MSMSDLQRLGQEFDHMSYKGWSIDFDMKPIPSRAFDWTATWLFFDDCDFPEYVW